MPHRWHEDDEIISLSEYFRMNTWEDQESREAAIGRATALVNRRTQRDGAPVFNNRRSMKMKFQNWRHLQYPGAPSGLPHVAERSIAIWEQYAQDRDALAREMERIQESFEND